MSEKLPQNNEHQAETQPIKHEEIVAPRQKNETINHKNEHQEQIGEIRRRIEQSSKKSEEINKTKQDAEPKHKHQPTNVAVGSQLYSQALKQKLRTIQRKLPTGQRQFSQFIHNPTIEKLSDGAGATIARPSGLLFAGIFSFATSLVVMIISRYYGYEYNYLVGLVSLAGGFVAGLLVEAALKAFKKLKTN